MYQARVCAQLMLSLEHQQQKLDQTALHFKMNYIEAHMHIISSSLAVSNTHLQKYYDKQKDNSVLLSTIIVQLNVQMLQMCLPT